MTTDQPAWTTTTITAIAAGWAATYQWDEDRRSGYPAAVLPIPAVLTQTTEAGNTRHIAAVFDRNGNLIPVHEHEIDGEFLAVDPAPDHEDAHA